MARYNLTHIGFFSQDLSHLIRILNGLRVAFYALLGRIHQALRASAWGVWAWKRA